MSQGLPDLGSASGSGVSPAQAPVLPLRHVRVAGVEWGNVLDFTQVFRGFRLAINPAKIVIALLAILLIYTAGRTFDFAWGPQAFKGEIELFQTERPENYKAVHRGQLNDRGTELEDLLHRVDAQDNTIKPEEMERLKGHPREALRTLKSAYKAQFNKEVADAYERRVKSEEDLKRNLSVPASQSPAEIEQDERAAAAKTLLDRVERAKDVAGRGIFDIFLGYELRQFDALVDNTLSFVRVAPVHGANASGATIEGETVSGALLSKDPAHLWQSDTVAGCVANMVVTGPEWLFSGTAPMQWHSGGNVNPAPDTWAAWGKMVVYRGAYLVSLILLAGFSLVVLALAGAIISRLSALEMAGVERASLKDVVRFSVRRLWVFVKAPITPFLIVLAIGLMLTVVGLIGAIPFVGEIVLGVFFIVLLLGGFVLMLLLLGILGGFNLLYPTIAVEGADAFDAMSRAFAYVYARPWRLLFYSVIALVYGVITFLFVSFAVYLVLALTHTFTGWGTNLAGYNHGWYTGAPKLDTLWPVPSFGDLAGSTNWYAMSMTEYIGALFLHFWMYLLVCVGGAYVISYYFSSHTIIYLLMRRSVDGQAVTEVFMDEDVPEAAHVAAEETVAPVNAG